MSTLVLSLTLVAAMPAWRAATVDLPASAAVFPAGPGAQMANEQCLTCHSVDMVLLQPSLTLAQWTAEVKKMRDAYGAPLTEAMVAPLAAYLNGMQTAK